MFVKKHAQDDDFESPRNITTENNVDYLSYKFDEMDLAASWRMLTKQKMTIVNGIRLENASWRTWAKQRNNLKTVSPETLNWLKDSDVTWLYGPLHTVIKDMDEQDRYAKPKVTTTEDALGLMTALQQQPKESDEQQKQPKEQQKDSANQLSQPEEQVQQQEQQQKMEPAKEKDATVISSAVHPQRPTASPLQNGKPLKSALKKVTMSDILKRSVSELQIHNESSPTNLTSGISISEANQQLGAFSPSVIASHRQPKLRFNQYVEQCVALSSSSEDNSRKKTSRVRMASLNDETTTNEDTSTDDNDYDPDEDSDAGSLIVMRRPQKMRSSIKKIEPALLKTNSRSEDSINSDSSDDEIIPTSSNNAYRQRKSHRHHKSSHHHHHEDWDAESAESDAFLSHIIQVSKGKQPIVHHGSASSRIPANEVHWETNRFSNDDEEILQSKSDYDYVFDDDDWDTHSEHMDDFPKFSQSYSYDEDEGGHNLPNASNSSTHTTAHIEVSPNPKIERDTNNKVDTMRSGSNGGNNGNSSLFSNIANWASSHLWPSDDDSSKQ
ncbi:hypothetical protein A0J61_08553 [Choanephora cucurbitarum]|uniref:Nitrogen regulatory protein areA GATA-like domain-containing protein n=1 Tax=Choanephora cucurbitarum TaxID=101091 RepID=A0A1C7N320_9FUNG|nr:hypothetical protein A0J61_08553 [Choanephora cucurbitarum]